MSETEDHTFRRPWRKIEEGESVRVVDAGGFPICYIYFDDESSRASNTRRMNRKQAHIVANRIVGIGAEPEDL